MSLLIEASHRKNRLTSHVMSYYMYLLIFKCINEIIFLTLCHVIVGCIVVVPYVLYVYFCRFHWFVGLLSPRNPICEKGPILATSSLIRYVLDHCFHCKMKSHSKISFVQRLVKANIRCEVFVHVCGVELRSKQVV